MSISVKRESITPSKARSILNASAVVGFQNRNPSNASVDRYAHDMEKGNWQTDTLEPIKISPDGALIDGQHRMLAIIKSKATVKIWIARDVPKEMFQYIDQGNSRDLKDLMSIKGWDDPSIVAVTAKMIWRRDRCGEPYAHAGKFSESEGNIFDWVQEHRPNINTSWKTAKPIVRKVYNATFKGVPESLLFYLWFQWRKDDVTTAGLIFDYLGNPATQPAHKAIVFLNQYITEMNKLKAKGEFAQADMRHADFKQVLLDGCEHAWWLITTNSTIASYKGFKSGLGQRKSIKEKASA